MKALRFHAAHDLRLEDIPSPTCPPNSIRLSPAYTGICGTDLHEFASGPHLLPTANNPHPLTHAHLPQTLGHETSGTITELGSEVRNWKVGDRVVVNPCLSCSQHGVAECGSCQRGRRNICCNVAFYGINATSGGFAEEMIVHESALVALPDGVSLKLGALAEPLCVAAHMVRMAGVSKGMRVLVLGAGPIGCAIVFMCREAGCSEILVSEVAERRKAMAKGWGATQVLDPRSDDVVKAVHAVTDGEGVDVAFDAAGLQVTLDSAVASVRPGGCIFNVAIHEKKIQVDLNLLTIPEKRLMAGNAYTKEDYDQVMGLLGTRGKELEGFVTGVVALERAVEGGFKELVEGGEGHSKILIEIGGG